MKPKNNILKSLITICLTLSSTGSFAQDYHSLGKEFLHFKSGGEAQFQDNFKFSRETREKNLIVLESDHPECFVIFHVNNKNSKVIAYSTQNRFTTGPVVNSGEEAQTELLTALSKVPAEKDNLKTSFYTNRLPVGPMLNSKWAQNRWYNIYCPFDIRSKAGEHDLVGCVATAMGQIIRYYGKWNHFIIDKEYNFRGEVMISSSRKYEWDNMLDHPMNYDLEVSRFLADLGILVEMDYGPDCSSKGFGFARKKGFINLGYDSARTSWRSQDKQWLDEIYTNLERYHPVMIGGGNHAFVCDGYDAEGRLHFNMGWGGVLDGYYDSSCVSSFGYYTTETVFDAFPAGYENFASPKAIRLEDVEGQPSIVWSSPGKEGTRLFYNIYYSDNEYFSVRDTIIALDNLKPGRHNIMVSAVYPEGESLWIGPVSVYVQGELATDLDEAVNEAIINSLKAMNGGEDPAPLYSGDLEMIRELEVNEPCFHTSWIQIMPGIQDLKLNASALESNGLQDIKTLVHLQNLEISDFSGEMPDLTQLPKLVQLKFSSCSFEDLTFLKGIMNLMVLEFENCNISGQQLPENLNMLVHLSITGTQLNNTSFINSCPDLRILTIKRCGVKSLDIYSKMNRLICLDVSENLLNSSDFLQYLPNIKMVRASKNDIKILSMQNRHPHLYCADFSHNRIDTIQMAFTYKSLELFDLSYNEFSSPPHMEFVPGLKALNISNNRILHLEGIERFESITSLDMSGNLSSDVGPLMETDIISRLDYLNLTSNPLSKECFDEYIPILAGAIKELYVPDNYEPGSPCYPEVSYEKKQDGMLMNLSWFCEHESPERSFDLYVNDGEGLVLLKKGIINPYTDLEINQEETYTWVIKSNYKDTCFYSGQYHADGTGSGTGTYAVSDLNASVQVKVYPNPANQYMRLQGFSENCGPVGIHIINASGQVVKQEVMTPENGVAELAVNNLANGVYYYQVSAQKETIGSGTLIIAH